MSFPAISPSYQVRLLLTDYGERQVLNKVLGISSPSMPTDWHAALGQYLSGAGTPFGEAGTGGTEPSGAFNYSRALWPRDNATWTDPSSNIQATYGGVPISRVRCWVIPELAWPEILVSPWDTGGEPEFLGLFDAATGGNCWFHMAFIGNHLTTAPVGNQYYIPEDISNPGRTEMEVVLEGGSFAVSWKIKILDWLLRGNDFTPAVPYLGWVKRDISTSPGTPNSVDETVVEVSTSGTGYSRHDVSGSLDAATTTSGTSYVALNTTETWSPSADWGFQITGTLFDGSSGGMVSDMRTVIDGFFHPHNGDTINVGPGIPGTGGCYVTCN